MDVSKYCTVSVIIKRNAWISCGKQSNEIADRATACRATV